MSTFDHHSVDFAEHWREQTASLRAGCPAAHSTAHDGFFVLTRYEDVRRVLLDSTTFVCGRDLVLDGAASVVPGGVTVPTNSFRMGMMEMDAPEHRELRRVIAPWLSARAVDAHLPRLRELVTWCLDRITPLGRADVIDDLANPLPALVTLDLIGLPLERWQAYATTLHRAAYREPGSAREVAVLLAELLVTVQRIRADVPRAPSDVLAALCATQVNGRHLTDEEVVEQVFMLLNGGIDTSTALIGHVVLHLDQNADTRAALVADPALVPSFVDEVLRQVTPGTGVARTVAAPVEIAGTLLQPGDRVLLALGSADNDPEVFPDPDTIVLGGRGTSHLAFGAGAHRCVGAFLARLEVTVLVQELLRRLPDLTVDRAEVQPYPTIPLIAGFVRMPISFSPTAAEGAPGAELPVTSGRGVAVLR